MSAPSYVDGSSRSQRSMPRNVMSGPNCAPYRLIGHTVLLTRQPRQRSQAACRDVPATSPTWSPGRRTRKRPCRLAERLTEDLSQVDELSERLRIGAASQCLDAVAKHACQLGCRHRVEPILCRHESPSRTAKVSSGSSNVRCQAAVGHR